MSHPRGAVKSEILSEIVGEDIWIRCNIGASADVKGEIGKDIAVWLEGFEGVESAEDIKWDELFFVLETMAKHAGTPLPDGWRDDVLPFADFEDLILTLVDGATAGGAVELLSREDLEGEPGVGKLKTALAGSPGASGEGSRSDG